MSSPKDDKPTSEKVVPPRRLVKLIDENEEPHELAAHPPTTHDAGTPSPPRRISFGSQDVSAAPSPMAVPFSPSRLRGAKAHKLNAVRITRREFHENIGPQKSAFSFGRDRRCPVKCSGLASLAAALSYLKTFGDGDVSALTTPKAGHQSQSSRRVDNSTGLPVTIDDVMQVCELPLSMLTEEYITVHTAHDVVSRYMQHDRVLAQYTSVLEPMDLKIVEVLASPLDDFDSAPREPAVDLKSLRQRLVETQANHQFAVVVFYDRQLVADSLSVEDDEGADLEMNKSFLAAVQTPSMDAEDMDNDLAAFRDSRTSTEVAVVVGMTRNDRVQLAIPRFTSGRSGMQVLEVGLPVLHRGMSAANPYSERANGFLVMKRLNPGTVTSPELSLSGSSAALMAGAHEGLGVSTDGKPPQGLNMLQPPEEEHEEPHSPLVAPHRLAFQCIPSFARTLSSPQAVHMGSIGPRLGPHITAMALARTLLLGAPNGGVDVNSVVAKLAAPFEAVCQSSSSVEDVGSMCRVVFDREAFSTSVVPFAQNLCRPNAACTMPVADFQSALAALNKANDDKVNAVMIAHFDVGFAHWTVDIGHKDTGRSHWAVISRMEEADDTVEVVDMLPTKFGFVWTVDVEQLHRAMTNKGYVIITRNGGVDASAFAPEIESSIVDLASNLPPYLSPLGSDGPFNIGATLRPGVPLSLLGVAMSYRSPKASLSAMLSHAPVSVAHLLDDRIGLYDYAAVARVCLEGMGIHATVETRSFAFSLGGFSTIDGPQKSFEEVVKAAADPDAIVIFNFLRTGLTGHYIRELRGPAQPTEFALLLGTVGEDHLALLSPDPAAVKRRWVTLRSAMLDACTPTCPVTGRPLGALVIRIQQDKSKSDAASSEADVTRTALLRRDRQWSRFEVPSLTPFRGSPVVAASAAAMVLTAIGAPCSAEDLVYGRCSESHDAPRATEVAVAEGLDALDGLLQHAEGGLFNALQGRKLSLRQEKIDSEGALRALLKANAPRAGTAADDAKANPQVAIVLQYELAQVHDNATPGLGYGIALEIVEEKDSEPVVVVADAQPSMYDETWSRPLAELFSAVHGPRGAVAVVRLDERDSKDAPS